MVVVVVVAEVGDEVVAGTRTVFPTTNIITIHSIEIPLVVVMVVDEEEGGVIEVVVVEEEVAVGAITRIGRKIGSKWRKNPLAFQVRTLSALCYIR